MFALFQEGKKDWRRDGRGKEERGNKERTWVKGMNLAWMCHGLISNGARSVYFWDVRGGKARKEKSPDLNR